MKYAKTYLKIAVGGIIIAFIYHYIVGKYLNYGWPYNSFLFTPKDRFMDFFNVAMSGKFVRQGLSPYGRGVINIYMPLINWITVPLSFGNDALRIGLYISAIIIVFFIYFYKFIYKLNGENKKEALEYGLFFLISSYPVIFLIDRGNFEFFVFIFLGLFIYYYKKEKYFLSSLMLMLATSLKPFSIVFIILYISDKKYRQLFSYIIGTIVIFFISLMGLHGGLVANFQNWLKELNNYNLYYVDLWMGSYYNHTLFSPIHLLNWEIYIYTFTQLRKIYFSIAAIIFILISVYIIEKEKSFSRKTLLLFLCMIGLPYVSADYTLINMYIPITLFISEMQNEKNNKYVNSIVILLSLLMIPKNYSLPLTNLKYGLSVIINPILIIILFVVIIALSRYSNKNNYIT